MASLEARLAAAGSTGIFLDVHPANLGALRFYERLGYRAVTETPPSSMFVAKPLD
jgi:ribosomal protein S18 acetylase RimI-like enzyme